MSEQLARQFHEIYERLAPSFGYETRTETRAFEPTTPNGRLMIAVTDEIEAAIQQRIAELTAELARRDEIITRLKEDAERLLEFVQHIPNGGGTCWVNEKLGSRCVCGLSDAITLHRALMKEIGG